MKKGGYTLIELICVMSILVMLMGCGLTMFSIMSNLKAEVEFEGAVEEISSILSYGKAYCRFNMTDGEIIIDTVGSGIIFRDTKTVVKRIQFSKSVTVAVRGGNSTIININSDGFLKRACNIEVTYKNQQKVITIAVGMDKVTVKPKQEIVSIIEESE